MKPVLPNSKIFGTNQEISWDVTVYNTPLTINSTGMVYRPATPLNTFGSGINLLTATEAAMQTHFDNNTLPGVVDDSGLEVLGRIPIIYDYWGRGAPIGVSTAARAAIRVRGLVKNTGNYGLAVLGKGAARIFQNGTEVIGGKFGELTPLYTSALQSFTAGDEIDIFYWALDVEWAGWAIRVFDDANVVSGGLDWELLRETDILSASWMDANEPVTSVSIDEVSSVILDIRVGQPPRCSFTLPSAPVNNVTGWYWDYTTNSLINILDPTQTFKKNHRIVLTGPFTGEQYTEFTGYIDDIVPSDKVIQVTCTGWEGYLSKQLSENYPDRLSYAAFGYTKRRGTENPTWNVPAYDHWPYEHAIKDLLGRSWIDPSLLSAKKKFLRVGQTVPEDGDNGTFRVRSLTGDHIRIERMPHYGNPNGDPDRPPDDPYLTPSKGNESVFNRIKTLSDRIGYIFRTDHEGNFVLKPRNNATSIEQIVHPTDANNLVNPAAIGGTYANYVGTGWSYTSGNLKGSRLDIVVGRGSGLGTIDVGILRLEDSWSDTVTIDTNYVNDIFYYDRFVTVNDANLSTFTVLSGADYGTYQVTITPNGGGGGTEYRLDSILVYDADPTTPTSLFSLKTFENVTELQGRTTTPFHVNDAIVTGIRRSTLTDSGKAANSVSSEYVVSRATDVNAILNPDAINYDGRKITAFLSNESVTGQDLADWAAITLVSRYRLPIPELSIQHTVLPVLELFDPVYIEDNEYQSFDPATVRWVTGFRTTYTRNSALSNVELTSFQEIPSYEPKEEIDISLFNNKPAINLNITYPSLDGVNTIINPGDDLSVAATRTVVSGTVSPPSVPNIYGTFSVAISDTISPGSELFKVTINEEDKYFKNNPYQKIYELNGTELRLYFDMADGSPEYRFGGWGLTTQNAEYSYFEIQNPYGASGIPFYDPYYSEFLTPQLIEVGFDALISGFYRVSVVDARDSTNPLTVAWLTQPGTEDPAEESHWEYVPAGPGKQYFWDGVDNLGSWNKRQSEEYGWRMRGVFEDIEQPQVGAGYYSWNDNGTVPTHISDELDGGEIAYPIDKFSQYFIKIEVVRDTQEIPLIVRSNIDEDMLDSTASQLSARYIYYHLPQPNTVSISIEDWDDSVSDYDPVSPGSSWNATPDNDASFRDGKPVRVNITSNDRLGAAFAGDDFTVNLKLNRVAALNSIVMDQAIVFMGEPWTDSRPTIENKRVVSRRFISDWTKIFSDEDFLPETEISPWVFYPSLFETDFGNGEEEPIEYLNYLQMTEVPHWNPQRRTGEKRSRLNFAQIAYLFYLSVYSQDRSGRLSWAVDESFVDKSKILGNVDTTVLPENLNRHQRRTIYTRQWWDYPALDAVVGASGWNASPSFWGGYSDRWNVTDSDEAEPLYPTATDTYRNDSTLSGNVDDYSDEVVFLDRLPTTFNSNDRDLGTSFGAGNSDLGLWTWEAGDNILWITNITRDYHPFYLVPPMGLMSRSTGGGARPYWPYNYVYASTVYGVEDREPDEARNDNWFAWAPDYLSLGTLHSEIEKYKMSPGFVVADIISTNETTGPIDGPNIRVGDLQPGLLQFQKQDDILRYENSRGNFSHGPLAARDLINVVGGNPYYINPIQYRTFDTRLVIDSNRLGRRLYQNDVVENGWFFLTFREKYNWESASLFPVNQNRYLMPEAIDADLTGSPVISENLDPGAWIGWKDDHPGSNDAGIWPDTGNCSTIHWRNTHTNYDNLAETLAQAGGACSTSGDPNTPLAQEELKATYQTDQNIFQQTYREDIITYDYSAQSGNVDPVFFQKNWDYMPLAVGPRLPETRRVLFALCLENLRRLSKVPGI